MHVFFEPPCTQDVVRKLSSINSIKETAQIIRNAMKQVDFKLDDRFCDAEELKASWQSTSLPDCLVIFFSEVFNIPQIDLMNCFRDTEDPYLDEYFNSSVEEVSYRADLKKEGRNRKSTNIMSIFQIMYYV